MDKIQSAPKTPQTALLGSVIPGTRRHCVLQFSRTCTNPGKLARGRLAKRNGLKNLTVFANLIDATVGDGALIPAASYGIADGCYES